MTSPENKRKELEHILKKENFVSIGNAIKKLRNEPPFKGAIGLLISFYDETDSNSVKKLITEFLNDLKEHALREEVMAAVKTKIKPDTLCMLVSSCWQSGLNYADYTLDFAEIFVAGDYMTAVECFTVIESSAVNITRSKKDEVIRIINEGMNEISSDKQNLAIELISILR
jgi:hypothetical protein